MTRYIPNTITLINLLSGCMAIMCACYPLETISGHPAYIIAVCFILLASVADFLDGLSARLLDKYSPLGKQLDSLSDLVSFGVAPAMLLSNLLMAAGAPLWSRLICLLVPLCGALRLARFNIDTTQTHSFRGLPIPAAALFCIGLAAMLASPSGVNLYAAVGCIVAVSLIMVFPVRMYSFKLSNLKLKDNLLPFSLVVIAVVCLIWQGFAGLFYAIAYYIISSFVVATFTLTPRN